MSLDRMQDAPPAPADPFLRDPRFLALSPVQQTAYRHARAWRQQVASELPLSREERERQDALWQEMAFAFLEVGKTALEQFAHNPDTFPKDRYAISPIVSTFEKAHDPRTAYEKRDSHAREPLSDRYVNIDAPLAYALMYRRTGVEKKFVVGADGKGEIKEVVRDFWEPISVIGFTPDLQAQVLLVDQLQGGSTSADLTTKDGKRARMKFAKKPEDILFDMVRDLAVKTNMRGIGLRKPDRNMWPSVTGRARMNKPTLYKSMAQSRNLRRFGSKDYYLDPLNRPESNSPDTPFLFP